MRTLHLLRHAKSDWDDPDLPDLDRQLNERGRRDALALGEYLLPSAVRPRLVLCSPAVRTRQTLDLVSAGLGLQARVVVAGGLYAASVGTLWQQALALPDFVSDSAADEALFVGHNPGLHELAAALAGATTGKTVARLQKKLPTCALATLRWDTDSWAKIDLTTAELTGYTTPRDR
jgi:phosphohistidine phosphatase